MEPTPGFVQLSYAPGIAPVFAIVLALIAFAIALFLLGTWPPTAQRYLAAGAFGAGCCLLVMYLGARQRVELDPVRRLVVVRKEVLGVPTRAETLAGDVAAVTVRAIRPSAARDNKTTGRTRFVVELQTPRGAIDVETREEPLDAENEALRIANAGGWKAERKGYELVVERKPAGTDAKSWTIEDASRALDRGDGRRWSVMRTYTGEGRTTVVRIAFADQERSRIASPHEAPPSIEPPGAR
ncbi:MAG: hypothetical protein SFV54_28215 [Bryobacteraceae bacterium]|nr:hypothetical protein [Bryobacteraceae bacterium]